MQDCLEPSEMALGKPSRKHVQTVLRILYARRGQLPNKPLPPRNMDVCTAYAQVLRNHQQNQGRANTPSTPSTSSNRPVTDESSGFNEDLSYRRVRIPPCIRRTIKLEPGWYWRGWICLSGGRLAGVSGYTEYVTTYGVQHRKYL